MSLEKLLITLFAFVEKLGVIVDNLIKKSYKAVDKTLALLNEMDIMIIRQHSVFALPIIIKRGIKMITVFYYVGAQRRSIEITLAEFLCGVVA